MTTYNWQRRLEIKRVEFLCDAFHEVFDQRVSIETFNQLVEVNHSFYEFATHFPVVLVFGNVYFDVNQHFSCDCLRFNSKVDMCVLLLVMIVALVHVVVEAVASKNHFVDVKRSERKVQASKSDNSSDSHDWSNAPTIHK